MDRRHSTTAAAKTAAVARLWADCERLAALEVTAKQSGDLMAFDRASARTSKAYIRYANACSAQRVAS